MRRLASAVLAARLLGREGRASVERLLLLDELLDLVPPALMVQVDVKAHADAALSRRTVNALAVVLARRPDAGRVEVLSFHAAAVKQAVSHGLAGRLVAGRTTRPPRSRGGQQESACAACASSTSCSTTRSLPRCATLGSASPPAVNDAAIAERALVHAPDALTTDRPHRLAAELAERRLLVA